MRAPLEGIRVVEVAHYVAVPAAGAMLADLGADVVKVEIPPRGEIYRRSKPAWNGYRSDFPEGPGFHLDNRGKRSIVLDLTRAEAREALLAVLDGTDVMLTNLLPGRRRKYGLDHETLQARRPELIVAAINGYGLGGEEADRPAFDYAAYWARTGMMDLMRDEGLPPSMLRPGVGDHAAASNLVCGVLSALRLRDTDGKGRYVETSLFQTGFHVLGCDAAVGLATGEPVRRHDRASAPNPLWNSYPTSDGRWLMLVMIEPDRYWPRFCAALERPDLAAEPAAKDLKELSKESPRLIRSIEAAIRERPLTHWREAFDRAGLIWAPVQTLEEALADPQAHAMGYFGELEHPEAGRFPSMGPPFRIENSELGPRRSISPLGADADSVFREAGLDLDAPTIRRLAGQEEEQS